MKIRDQWGFSHTTLSHTMFHTPLCHRRNLSHTTLSHHLSFETVPHTIFHAALSQTHNLSHTTLSHHLSHTTLSQAIFRTPVSHKQITLPHTTLSHTTFWMQFSRLWILHHLLCPFVPLQLLFLLIGTRWLVVLSGPVLSPALG